MLQVASYGDEHRKSISSPCHNNSTNKRVENTNKK